MAAHRKDASKVEGEDEFLTPAEVSERLKVSRQTLSHWRRNGVGPFSFNVGNLVRYRRSDFEAWLAEQYADGKGQRGCASD